MLKSYILVWNRVRVSGTGGTPQPKILWVPPPPPPGLHWCLFYWPWTVKRTTFLPCIPRLPTRRKQTGFPPAVSRFNIPLCLKGLCTHDCSFSHSHHSRPRFTSLYTLYQRKLLWFSPSVPPFLCSTWLQHSMRSGWSAFSHANFVAMVTNHWSSGSRR